MLINRFRHQQAPTRLLGTLLAAYWLLAAMALCVPMSVEASAVENMASHHSAMADMPCCDDNALETPSLADCENGVPDSAKLTEMQCQLDTPLLQLLFILSEPIDSSPPPLDRLATSFSSTYPRLHLTLGVQLD